MCAFRQALSLPQSERCRQFLFVSWVALLMSCNIKLEVSESSQLSVSLVVLACWAAHLCLLDKTCSTLLRENTMSPILFFFPFLSPMLSLSLCFCLILSFPLSVFLTPSPCLSTQYRLYLAFLFYFSNPPLPFPPVLLPTVLYSLFFLAFFPASLFLLSFCFPSPSSPAVRFYFVLFWDLFVSPLV